MIQLPADLPLKTVAPHQSDDQQIDKASATSKTPDSAKYSGRTLPRSISRDDPVVNRINTSCAPTDGHPFSAEGANISVAARPTHRHILSRQECIGGMSGLTHEPEQTLPEPMPLLPLSTFPHQQSHQFLEKNKDFIQSWLQKNLPEKGFTVSRMRYMDRMTEGMPQDNNHPAIEIDLTFNDTTEHLYYTSVDINKADSPEACFQHLLHELRTDALMLYLKATYPAAFNNKSGLFINDYDCSRDTVELIRRKRIRNNSQFKEKVYTVPLTYFFNPATKSFSWDKLKELMQQSGLKFQALFTHAKTSRLRSAPTQPMIGATSLDFFDDLSEFDKPDLPIPTGQLDTSKFLF